MTGVASNPVMTRYHDLGAAIRARSGQPGGPHVAYGSLPAEPLQGYERGEIMLGSRVDDNPESVDLVHVYSSRQEGGQEHFSMEAFVEYTERGALDRLFGRPGEACLHHYVTEYVRGASGSQLVDVLLATFDPRTGEIREALRGNDAIKAVWKLEERTGAHITS